MTGTVQLGLLPVSPDELAQLTAPERRAVYDRLGLDHFQRQAVEDAVRLIVAGKYPGRRAA